MLADRDEVILEVRMLPCQDLRPPTRTALLREALIVLEVPRFFLSMPWLVTRHRGAGEPVIVIPGFATSDTSTVLVRKYLHYLGYGVRGWGLGLNTGNVARFIPRLVAGAATLARESGQKVRLIGWSLGGFLAREVARECPEAVDRVITLGTPVVGGPKYTQSGEWYRKKGYDLDEIEAKLAERSGVPLKVPVTAIYSRLDGVVTWQACVDHKEADVSHHEVTTTHLGLVSSPEVLLVLAETLK